MKKFSLFIVLLTFASCAAVAESINLPLWKEKAEALGYTLPKPLGLNLSYMAMEQGINVDSIAIQGLPFQQLVLDLKAEPGRQYTEVLTLRADVWLLPFLNVYGLVGK
ncbi:MAG: hypothetical protein ACRCXH_05705, partial [Shewanella sp.]